LFSLGMVWDEDAETEVAMTTRATTKRLRVEIVILLGLEVVRSIIV